MYNHYTPRIDQPHLFRVCLSSAYEEYKVKEELIAGICMEIM
jgi:hypothetical protein